MDSNASKRALIWGGLMIVLGGLLLVEIFTDLNAWIWVAILFIAGLIAFGAYLTERSDWGMLLTAYILWAITGLIALVMLDVLQDDLIAFYVLFAIAIPFLVVYLRDRKQWWALIPAYVLAVVAVMIGLTGLGILSDLLVPAYIMFAIAIPFFVVFARDRKQWWALIPGGIMAVIGFSFFAAEGFFAYAAAAALIIFGVWILVRAFSRKELPEQEPPSTDLEDEEAQIE